MKINGNATDGIDLDVKRFYMAGVTLTDDCPGCGVAVVYDFGADYLSYPTANREFDFNMYCNKCSHEWKVPLILRVTLDAARSKEAK